MTPDPAGPLRVPVVAGTYRVSSGFGLRGGAPHRGIDFASITPGRSYLGAKILAAADGTVMEARDGVQGFGCWVWLRHLIGGHPLDTIYGHMYPDGLHVTAGQRVTVGQNIADVGNNGDSSGAHLHFEVWTAPGRVGGDAVDPAPWLGL